jgi:hypothetical protein
LPHGLFCGKSAPWSNCLVKVCVRPLVAFDDAADLSTMSTW